MYSGLRFATLGVLLFAIWHMGETFAARPAFNRSLQVEAVTGGYRPLMQQSLYSDSQYLFQIAYGYQNASAVSLLGQGMEGMPSAEVFAANAEKARGFALESLRKSPANPEAWLALAAAEGTLGEPTVIIAPDIENSRKLAPGIHATLQRRLFLAVMLADTATHQNEETPESVLDGIAIDARALKKVKPRALEQLLELPFAKPILEKALSD